MLSLSQILIIPITVSASYHCRTVQLILQDMRIFSPNVLPQQCSTETCDATVSRAPRCFSYNIGESLRSIRETFLWTVSVMKSWVDSEHQQTLRQTAKHFPPPQKSAWLFPLRLRQSLFMGTNTHWNERLFAVNSTENRSFPELRVAFYTDIYCMYYTDQQTKTPKINIITESQRRAHIWEARTWKCFALLLRKWLERLKKTVAD